MRRGVIAPPDGLSLAGCLRDGAPGAWGRRVIINRLFGKKGADIDAGSVDELIYLIQSGSHRIGALDFQAWGASYEPRLKEAAS